MLLVIRFLKTLRSLFCQFGGSYGLFCRLSYWGRQYGRLLFYLSKREHGRLMRRAKG